MKHLRNILATLLALIASIAIAQPVIVFDKQRHDFGTIEEANGKVTYDFVFVNTGNEPLVISNVRTSCGCTAPEYSQEPVAPDSVGNVKITFDPSGRPGKFSKSIYVYTNTEPNRTILRIIGEVVRSGKKIDTQYAYRIGNMALKSLHIPLDKIVKGRISTGSIEVANVGNDTLIPLIENTPNHINVGFMPSVLPPNTTGTLHITYDPDAIDDWGYRRDEFNIVKESVGITPENEAQYNTITLSGVLQEDFDSYTDEQRENAPILVVGNNNVNFKVVKGTQKVQREVYVVNAGFSPLVIHKVRCDNSAIQAHIKKTKLKPGQSTKLIIEADPMRAKSNTLISDLYIVSNDPGKPSQAIRVTAEFQ